MFEVIKRALNPVDPETVVALRHKLPDKIFVSIHEDPAGKYVAKIEYIMGRAFSTEGETGDELIDMVNDAMFTVLGIPEPYRPYMGGFEPTEEVRKAIKADIPKQYLDRKFDLVKA
jgi:hypothetical protein